MSENTQVSPVVAIRASFVKNSHVEVPVRPYSQPGPYSINIELNHGNYPMNGEADHYIIEASVEIVATEESGRELFKAAVAMEFVALVQNVPDEEKAPILEVYLPTQALPYLRSALSNLTMASGYPQIVLPPMAIRSKNT